MGNSAEPSDTILWVTGATSGIGAALAAQVPYDNARVINIARRAHPSLESVRADLSDPADWDRVEAHFAEVLANFSGTRAVFVNNAFMPGALGFIGDLDAAAYRRQIQANVAAPLVLGEAFFRHVPPGVEAGLVMMSSASARIPYAGHAAYCAGKAAMEQWVRAVRSELALRETRNWVVAIRPGAVDTPALRSDAEGDPDQNPLVPLVREALEQGLVDTPEVAARRIWDVLATPLGNPPIVLLGEVISAATVGKK